MTELTDTERETLRCVCHVATGDRTWHIATCRVPAVEAILTARLARIEALADEWDALGDTDSAFWWSTLATHLRAALAAPTPTEVQPCEAGDCDRPVSLGLIPLCAEHRAEFKAWREVQP